MYKKFIKKIPGMVPLARLLGLTSVKGKRSFLLDMLPKRSKGAEIGVHIGDFSRKVLDVIKPRELYLIDPWEYQESETYKNALYGGGAKKGQKEMDDRYLNVCARFEQEIRAGVVKVKRGYSSDILETVPDGYFDWVYIDGNHLYEYVKQDLELSLRKIRAGGYITGDDYVDGGWWQGGVKKAVDEFVKEKSIKLVIIQNGQFVLQKIS